MTLAVFFMLLYLAAANSVFDKYIELKRSLKTESLPAKKVLPPSPVPLGVDRDTGKTELAMRAMMLVKVLPSNHTANKQRHKYASGHTFIPSVHTNLTWPVIRTQSKTTKPSPKHERKETIANEQVDRNRTQKIHKPSQDMIGALVGQGGHTRVTNFTANEGKVVRNVWSGSQAVPALLLGLLVWSCVLISRKRGARKKARVV